jgi:hypothetical protein
MPPASNQDRKWQEFKSMLNDWGGLEWVIKESSKTTVFLDLNSKLHQSVIHTSTYQKSLNLYLYIPLRSAHPPSCLKGLISGELRRYWLQNSPDNFKIIVIKFIERLIDRGHSLQDLSPLFTNAAATLANEAHRSPPVLHSKVLYIHWVFHPNRLQRSDIRMAYNKTLQPLLDYDKMTVAISRPHNLQDKLTKTQLQTSSSLDIQKLIQDQNS